METRSHGLLIAIVVLVTPASAASAPSDNCPTSSPFTVSLPGPFGTEECFTTVDGRHHFYAPVRWDGAGTDLLIGLASDFGLDSSFQSVEVWSGGSEWGSGTVAEVLVDHSMWVWNDTVVAWVQGDTDGDGLEEVGYAWSDWTSRYCEGGYASLFEQTGPEATWGVYMLGLAWDHRLGDVNGDGFDDIAGADGVLLGSPDGSWATNAAVLPSTLPVAGRIGDINGDGYDDIRLWDQPNAQSSWAPGSASSLGPAQPFPISGATYPLGDIDGDGFDDILIVEPAASYWESETATVHLGSAGGPATDGSCCSREPGSSTSAGSRRATSTETASATFSWVTTAMSAPTRATTTKRHCCTSGGPWARREVRPGSESSQGGSLETSTRTDWSTW